VNTVFDLKNSVAAMLSGINIQNVDDLNGCFERSARTLSQKAKIPETQGTQNILLYSGVYDYPIDTRIFGTNVLDIKPQGQPRNPTNFVFKKFADDFDRQKGFQRQGTFCTFAYNQGTPIIRIVSSVTPPQIIIDPMNQIGNWVASGTASGLTQDTAIYYQQPASLRFTLGVGTGILTETLSSPINISSYQGVGLAFLAIDIPVGATAADLTSIILKLGSNSSNYSSVTATQGFLGAWTAGNWLLVAFDFSQATNTGTPNWSAIDYIQVSLASTQSMVNFRVGGLFISQPSSFQILYGSAGFFLQNGVVSTSITADTDTIILNDAAYTIYQNECALATLQQVGGGIGDSSMSRIDAVLNGTRTRTGIVVTLGLYDLYKGDNPSEVLKQSGSWYDSGGIGGGYDGY
jgi:hypothetical protein